MAGRICGGQQQDLPPFPLVFLLIRRRLYLHNHVIMVPRPEAALRLDVLGFPRKSTLDKICRPKVASIAGGRHVYFCLSGRKAMRHNFVMRQLC
jgi:hypothetical protein